MMGGSFAETDEDDVSTLAGELAVFIVVDAALFGAGYAASSLYVLRSCGVAVEAVERGQAKLEQADKAQVWEGAREARMLACSTPAPPECTPTTAFISITASCVSHDHTVCAGRGPAVALRGCRRGAR